MSRTIIVSNRVPVPSTTGAQAGGLAVVLRELLEKRGGIWFGWSGAISDETRVTTTRSDRVKYATIDLTRAEHDGYYNGFSNGMLWPLLHTMPSLVTYQRDDAAMYDQVNDRMADALAALVKPDDTIWVQDYHLFSLPAALRARGLRNPIGFFLHIPFPPPAILAAVPGMGRLVRNVLAADLIGFQIRQDVVNFEAAACSAAQARLISPGLLATGPLNTGRDVTRLDVFPVEIDPAAFAATAARAAASPAAARLKASLQGQQLVLGVDRLDPSKGLPERLEAFDRLLKRHPNWHRRATLLQIAASSRGEVEAYRTLRHRLESLAGRINADHGTADWTPVRLITRACERDVVAGTMRQASVGLVTPLRDGMNLVAKEYIAAQDPANPGTLVLSRFAGAADQLGDALLVNPNDPDTITEALDAALRMDLRTRQLRWGKSWNAIKDRSARRWGDAFLAALADTRRGAADGAAPQPPSAVMPANLAPAKTDPETAGNRVVQLVPRPQIPAPPHLSPLVHGFDRYRSDRTH